MSKVKVLLFGILFFVSIQLRAADFECIKVDAAEITLIGEKNSSVYDSDQKLIFVFAKDGKHTITGYSQNQLCFRGNVRLAESKRSMSEMEIIDKFNSKKYHTSILLLALVMFYLVFKLILKYDFGFFDFKAEDRSTVLTTVLLFLITFLFSLLLSNKIFSDVLYLSFGLIIIKLFSSVVMSRIFNVSSDLPYIFNLLFKLLNITFIISVSIKLLAPSFLENIDLDYSFIIFALIIIVSTIVNFYKSNKKTRSTHLFYYLCALEILPMLFLKEII